MSTPNEPPISFFLDDRGISVWPPSGGHQRWRRPTDPQKLEEVLRLLLKDEPLSPEEKESQVQRLLKNAEERWPHKPSPPDPSA